MSVASRLRNLWSRLATRPPSPADLGPEPPRERWAGQFADGSVSPDDWLARARGQGRLYADLTDGQVDQLRQRFPRQVEATRASAERICRHEFDLLGSGACVPADKKRRSAVRDYQPIDWSWDPVQRLRFPTGFRHKQWTPAMRPANADVKWPWEIGRCQHWVTLGQAYRLTGDERFAAEIVREHADFLEAHPVGSGIQFVCTMDVAIRAFNWALAFELIRASAAFDARVMPAAYESLFDLGVFIEGNLENKYEVTSNHFLSNVVGLYAVALVFSDLPAGRRWLAQCREWLETEMRVQVLEDGADYESSIPYHRLVTELFLGAARVAQLEGTPLSPEYLDRLRRMVDFMQAVVRPDGLLPQIGDADDGRLHIFTGYGTWKPQDGRHLFEPAARFFNEPAWSGLGGEDGFWEAAWWGWLPSAVAAPASLADGARLFPEAGVMVCRAAGTYLLVSNGRVGTSGFGNHKHNDLLSFEFHAGGRALIVDPGSYLYTSKPDERNRFRATAYHNTVQVDGIEQNDLRLDYLFRMFETSQTSHAGFEDGPVRTTYAGSHSGYERLPEPVTHHRAFQLTKEPGALVITDTLTGSGRHTIRWHFHLAPGVTVSSHRGGLFTLANEAGQWQLRAPAELEATVSDAWYSPSFGVRQPCRAIDMMVETDVATAGAFTFQIAPGESAAVPRTS